MEIEIYSCGYAYHMMPFSTGERHPLSTFLFRLQTEGSCQAFVDGKMRTINVGDLLLFGPGDRYQLVMDRGANGKVSSGDYFLICDGDWIAEWWKRRNRPHCVRIGTDERVMTIWKQMIVEKRRVGEKSSELNGYLLQAICLYFDRAIKEAVSDTRGSFLAFRMKRYIEEQAADAFKVEDVARQVDLSASRAAHIFKETFGESIMQYVLRVRLTMAVERMKYSSLSLEQIADSCGLGSYPYFHRVFKDKFGMPPSEYRKKWKAESDKHVSY